MTKVAIFGAGQIGRAVFQILMNLRHTTSEYNPYYNISAFVIDANQHSLIKLPYGNHESIDLTNSSVEDLSKFLQEKKVTHVVNALPFFLNEKVASAAAASKCSYIDFTEDDVMADKVQEIYKGTGLDCAVKCGLAPGFINYVGYNLVDIIDTPDSLMISVGALPRTVSYNIDSPEDSYNLTWSVDGLVNEYIRPCRVRKNGKEQEVAALEGLIKVVLDGDEYEAAYTSGGIGSLVRDLTNVPNVHYMTLRYPGHYNYIKSMVNYTSGDFDKLREIFLNKFPFTDDDIIVVYANALGKDKDGTKIRRTYSNKFYGTDDLTGIQSTTAGSGVAILELMLSGHLKGIINHSDVNLGRFVETEAFKKYYKTKR
jgi:saccharopine dehydrogenase-like NADP-dependent oxidoreductase